MEVFKRLNGRRNKNFGASQVLWNVLEDKNNELLRSVLHAHMGIDKKIIMVKWLVENDSKHLDEYCIYCAIVNQLHMYTDEPRRNV